MLALVYCAHSGLEDLLSLLFWNAPDGFGSLNAPNCPVRLDQIFPPAKNPYVFAFTTRNDTAILISRSSHLLLSAGSSAFPCVDGDSNAKSVKHSQTFRPAVAQAMRARPTRGISNTFPI